MGQGARLFNGTLRENLTLGAPMAGNEAILAMLGQMGLAEFVHRLPEGLDHMALEGGIGLWGGQTQGLLLARLLLHRKNVLLFD